MKAVRCPNGHWYDSEAYDKCPHCGQTTATEQNKERETEKSAKKGFGLFKKDKSNRTTVTLVEKETIAQRKANISTDADATVVHEDVTERFFADIDDDKTMAMFEASDLVKNQPAPEPEKVKIPAPQVKVTSEPLAAAVQRISAMDEGKTLSYFNAMTAEKEAAAGSANIAKTVEPVVGWLVAVSGPHFGECFQLYAGRNSIGRSVTNKLVLELDQSVSRDAHAIIIYEPKRRQFYLQSGNADGLVYLNDAFINGSEIMKNKDIVELGASRLVFVPLCGEDFSWEQYIKGAEK